jgi:hypothetical protein
MTHHAWILVTALALGVVACSDDGASPGPDAPLTDQGPPGDGPRIDQPGQDAAPPDQNPDTLTVGTEQEPNDGATPTEYNAIQLPAQLTGAIGTANDVDLFGIAAQAGERFTVTLVSDGRSRAPPSSSACGTGATWGRPPRAWAARRSPTR